MSNGNAARKSGAPTESRREVARDIAADQEYPISMTLQIAGERYATQIINYHFRGACLKFSAQDSAKLAKVETLQGTLDIRLGKQLLQAELPFEQRWRDFEGSGCCGIEFSRGVHALMHRQKRFQSHGQIRPTLTAPDPLAPNRTLYFSVEDISLSGLKLSTSLSNKHLLPGMHLEKSKFHIPGHDGLIETDLSIANTRSGTEDGVFSVGVAFRKTDPELKMAIRTYLTRLSPIEGESRAGELRQTGMLDDSLRAGLTFRIVKTQDEYEKVLRLRFQGYALRGRTKTGSTWQGQGDGLENEGTILAAYLHSQLVASMELRFHDSPNGFRYFKSELSRSGEALNPEEVMEINKFVAHPDVQGRDIYVGLIQRIHVMLSTIGFKDIVVAANDRLANFYKKVGTELLGSKVPHPFIENEELNLMVMRRATYLGESSNINPYVWDMIYGAVHEQLAQSGLVRARRRSPVWWTKYAAGRVYAKVVMRKKGAAGASRGAEESPQRKSLTLFVDPKWTSQEMLASVILPYVLEADRIIGAEKVETILSKLGVPRNFLRNQNNWVSVSFLDEFLTAYAKFADVAELSRASGVRSLQYDVLGANYYALKHLLSPEVAFRGFERLMPRFNRTRIYRVINLRRGYLKAAVGLAPGYRLPRHAESCLNWQSNLETYIRILTGQKKTAVKMACCYKGDPECVYEIAWNPRTKTLPLVLRWLLVVSPALYVAVQSLVMGEVHHSLGVALAASGALSSVMLLLDLRKSFLDRADLSQSFERFQSESSDKYAELQDAKMRLDERYREAVILEDISKGIQRSDDLQSTLSFSLEAACKLLGFSRAFVMLASPDKSTLTTAAVLGGGAQIEGIWKYQVDVSAARDNPLVISSVFRSGSSVFIDDVETHQFQLNDASRLLMKQLQSRGFIIVAIPGSTNENWGVIVADKTGREAALSQKDVVPLQRVAQQLGIALDKHARLEKELKLRKLFQKYVPIRVVEGADSDANTTLGGEQRTIITMVLDIRDFTKMSNALPAAATIKLLNRVFGMLQGVVSEHAGIIDKFLGDGALVHWGITGDLRPDAEQAVLASLDILGKIRKLNTELQAEDLPAVRVGMGLHIGSAIVGNIGSQDRMEFTSIGPVVNLASRLEALCKELNGSIVISSELMALCTPQTRQLFREVNEVQVRGLENKITVGVFAGGPLIKLITNEG